MISRCSSSTKMFMPLPSGSTVAKILSRMRNDVRSKCGASVASGNANANRRTSAIFTANLALAWDAGSQYAALCVKQSGLMLPGGGLRPDAELVAARVHELKTPPPGEHERLAHDFAAG